MIRIRRLIALLTLVLAISLCTAQAFAGSIDTPGYTGEMSTPGAKGEILTPGNKGDILMPGIAGDILTPGFTLIARIASLIG
jgi:hypothetical protein